MGQCVTSYLERANANALTDFEPYINYSSYGPQMTVVPNTEGDKEYSPIYRMTNVSESEFKRLQSFERGEASCIKVMEKYCEERKDLPCLAYRVLQRIDKTKVTDDKGVEKTMDVYIFEEGHRTMTYTEFWNHIIACGRGLRSIGLHREDKLVMFEETRWEWLTTMYSCWSQELIVCTVYANLGEEALIAAFKEMRCAAIVCNGSNVVKVIEYLQKSKLNNVKIIYLDDIPVDVNSHEYELYAWTHLVHVGMSDVKELPYHIPDVEEVNDVALIMYTSGTTGDPKGVVHTHGSLRAGVRSLNARVMEYLGPPQSEEWYCSYLPLAHIMEFGVTSIFMIRGVIIGYGTPRTLTDQFARPHGDLVEYKPLFIVAVPRILESMKRAVEAKLPKTGTLKRRIFDNAYKARLRALQNGQDTPYYNQKVFAIPRKVIGGKLYGMLCGGGPLSAATQEFVNVVFGMVVQGYGLTETMCCGALQRTGNLEYDNVGQLLSCVELKLRNTGEFKYTDTPMPRGEICFRGACLMREYFKQPELTKEALDEDGWFHTGDVGAITPNFTLRIVGRVKSLAKNSNGEYLALEKLESVYGTNPVVVPGGVCVLVNPARSYIAVIGVTTSELVDKFKQANKLTGNYPEILDSADFKAAVLKSFQQTARDAKRRPFEVVKAARLISDEWSSSNGLLTVAMKLKRSAVETKYKELIDELFEHEERVEQVKQ